MSIARNIRRQRERSNNYHLAVLGELCGGFYEFLSGIRTKTYININYDNRIDENGHFCPTDLEVRDEFMARNHKWIEYCKNNNLSNAEHLFKLNIGEAWKRHAVVTSQENSN